MEKVKITCYILEDRKARNNLSGGRKRDGKEIQGIPDGAEGPQKLSDH